MTSGSGSSCGCGSSSISGCSRGSGGGISIVSCVIGSSLLYYLPQF